MNARILTTATLFATLAGVLTAQTVDSQMLSLLMPDAKVISGVNVDSAKSSTFGIYLIAQIQANSAALQQLVTLTGFDPTRDLHELLAATNATGGHSGLALARGNFDAAKITALAILAGASTETYSGVTIIEDPKQTGGAAFLDATLAMAGDIPSVKAAIGRQNSGQSLPASVVTLVNQWSGAEDAWVVTTVPPYTLTPPSGIPAVPGLGANAQGIFQKILGAGAGVKFGATVVTTVQATADNAQDAATLAQTLQLLVNIAQMQTGTNPNPNLAALLQGLSISAKGTALNIAVSLPEAQLQQLVQQGSKSTQTVVRPHVIRKK
ncbi:MAG: hypothetical protein ABSF62_17645 [Bryobacteraceae bacterium]